MSSYETERLLKTDSEEDVWLKLQEFFGKQIDEIRTIRDKNGFKEADAEHGRRLQDFLPCSEVLDQMFLEGQLRHPELTQVITDARASFYTLIKPLPNPCNEQISKLREMHRELSKRLQEANECLANGKNGVINILILSTHGETTGII